MELIGAALAGSGLTLIGVLITQWGEKRRREQELALRRLDHIHVHRERMFDHRLETYRAFGRAFLNHQRAHEHLGVWWGHRQFLTQQIKQTAPSEMSDMARRFDAAESELKSALETSRMAAQEVEDTLLLVESVASTEVLDAVKAAARAADDAWTARREFAEAITQGGPDEWSRLQHAIAQVEVARNDLREAMRKELELDHGRQTENP